ncbi:MAG: type III pantothenate kinase [Peptoniphilus lacydonensis]|jgi:pantothenate kinase, type III|uniref:type III pantothenate kinase n=1 Tax=Peptoniphilus TaxID=162289 RepID=UPI0025855012|nr:MULTISPECIES: type III pantothenate kinase [Peptoniphilus]MDU5594742.1 type III pantothenate kinase [Peptoniphilus rhinitidis]MDU7302543.1 type III pantothenate kinase [Peptoniphilus lacydonensis]
MLLAIDINNKNTNLGVFDEDKIITKFSIMTDRNRSTEEVKLILKLILKDRNIMLEDIDDIILSTVVPELYQNYEIISINLIGKKPKIISAGVKTGLNIKCESPRDVGSDRIIRAVAATNKYKDNLIIISASSITTIDYINAKKEFLGGLIFPGVNLLQKSLVRESSKLPQVEIKSCKDILGNNTEKAIQSGIYFGYKNAVSGVINEIFKKHSLNKKNTQILTTGIYANLLDNNEFEFVEEEMLGLEGLKIIYDLNKNKAS